MQYFPLAAPFLLALLVLIEAKVRDFDCGFRISLTESAIPSPQSAIGSKPSGRAFR